MKKETPRTKKTKMSANDAVRGHVYCLAIDAQPGTVKIGATTRDPAERLREANACTWSPWPFRLVVAAEVPDVWATERLLHALLSARRINDRREFFTLTPREASGLFAVLAPPHPVQADEVALSEPSADTASVPTPGEKLRTWIDARYSRIPLREKDTGTKLEALHAAYCAASPPVHSKILGKILFGKLLNTIYPNIGPHKNCAGSSLMYLFRQVNSH